jgi:hypothetical protein
LQSLTQITYASRALFQQSTDPYLVEPEVEDILRKSRANNRMRRIVGVLCFGDGYFLQCLQGEVNDLNQLLESIKKDKRHTDIQLLHQVTIDVKTFARWSMKYAGVSSEMRGMLALHGYNVFNPYLFNEATILAVINFLKSPSTD